MAVKLFVSDIDGTLTPSGKEISKKNIEAVREMAAAGIIVTIATGRMYRAALPIAQTLGVNVPIITYNGALIKSVSGEVIHSEYLPPEIVIEIIDFFERKGWQLQSYSEDILRFPIHDKYAQRYEDAQKLAGEAVGWDGLRKYTSHVCKMLSISDGAEQTDERVAVVKAAFGNKIDAVKSNAEYSEMVCPGVSKAAAVKILAKKFGIAREEVMAIGDSDNDLPMLKAAGTSIAMGNAVDAVKNSCDLVTGNCADDGFAEAVYKYVLK